MPPVESVSSSSTASIQPFRPEEQQARRAERPAQPPEDQAKPAEARRPEPTVNANGQTVGTTIDTTA